MSGGSYDYFCYKDDERRLRDIYQTCREMAVDLEAIENKAAMAAARDLRGLASLARDLTDRLGSTKMTEVLHAVEWWTSCDYGQDTLVEVLERWY